MADLELTLTVADADVLEELADDELAEYVDPVEYLLAIEDALADGDYTEARRLAEAYGDPELVTKLDWLEADASEPSEAIRYRGALERLGWSRREAHRAHVAHFLIGSRRGVTGLGSRRVGTRSICYRRSPRRTRRARAPGRRSAAGDAGDPSPHARPLHSRAAA